MATTTPLSTSPPRPPSARDSFHLSLTKTYPKMKAPSFRPERLSSNVVLLHYFSHYQGLAPYALSHVMGTAKLMYGIDIDVAHVERRDQGADHDVFRLELPDE